jgi:CRP-like cAMP-binding protein
MSAPSSNARPRNRLLAALPQNEYERLTEHLELVKLEVRDLVIEVNEPISHVHFLNTGVISMVGLMADGNPVETATIGYEGMVGLAVFHRTDRMAVQAFCQVASESLRLPATAFLAALEQSPELTTLLHRYTQAVFTQLAQASACNRIHSMRQRCARWLLQTNDRVGANEFPLTQDFLAQMLGVRRATVSEVAASMQDSGILEYSYGRMRIVSRPKLEHAACECYAIITSEYDRLIEGKRSPNPLDAVVASDGKKSTVGSPNPRSDAME